VVIQSFLAQAGVDSLGGAGLWVLVAVGVVIVALLLVLWIVSMRSLVAVRELAQETRTTSAEIKRWSDIAQRQTELASAPLLKVVSVEEVVAEQGRGMRIEVRNVGFGSAVNVKCITSDQSESEYVSPHTEIVGNETAAFDLPILIESVRSVRLEYLSQSGSYAHTTQYVVKSGAQSYALHRER
jgi:hypothetical protein